MGEVFSRSKRNAPACLGRARQLPWPERWMYATSFWSSSGVQGPFFSPNLSQHGARPILFADESSLVKWKKLACTPKRQSFEPDLQLKWASPRPAAASTRLKRYDMLHCSRGKTLATSRSLLYRNQCLQPQRWNRAQLTTTVFRNLF